MKINRKKIYWSIISSALFFLLNFGVMQYYPKSVAQKQLNIETHALQPEQPCSQTYLSCETNVNNCGSIISTDLPQ